MIQGITTAFRDIDRFTIKLDKLQVYCNDERTRTFVGLESTGGVMQLKKLSKAVDNVFKGRCFILTFNRKLFISLE